MVVYVLVVVPLPLKMKNNKMSKKKVESRTREGKYNNNYDERFLRSRCYRGCPGNTMYFLRTRMNETISSLLLLFIYWVDGRRQNRGKGERKIGLINVRTISWPFYIHLFICLSLSFSLFL